MAAAARMHQQAAARGSQASQLAPQAAPARTYLLCSRGSRSCWEDEGGRGAVGEGHDTT